MGTVDLASAPGPGSRPARPPAGWLAQGWWLRGWWAQGWWVAAIALAVVGLAGLVTHPGAATVSGGPHVVPATAVAGAAGAGAGAVGAGTGPTVTLDTFDAAVLAEVAAYRGPRRIAGLALLALALVVPLAAAGLLLSGSRRAPPPGDLTLSAPVPVPVPVQVQVQARQVAAWSASLVLVVALVRLPLLAWVRIVHDGRFAMRNQSAASWLADHLLAIGARAAVVALAAAGLTLLVRRSPHRWPAQLSVAATVVALLAVLLHPVVVHPLLLPEQDLPAGAHRDAVEAVVARSGLDVPVTLGAASIRTPRRNAVATGLGPTRRVVLHDTLLELAPDDVAALTAHELAHLEHRDLLRGALAVAPVALAVALALAALSGRDRRVRHPAQTLDAGHVPTTRTLVAMVALVLALEAAATPLIAAHSRRIETAADARAVVLAGDPAPLLVTLRAFVIDDLTDPEPPRWSALLASHPSAGVRIRAVLRAAEEAGLPVDEGSVLSAERSRPARR
jgi:STE24 endopeptidase